jgi:4'-phosphopantetheinyl transferase
MMLSPLIDLAPGQAHVWMMSIEQLDDAARLDYGALLTAAEKHRYRRFVHKGAGDQYLAGRALARSALSLHAQVEPPDWQFEFTTFGRPYIAKPEGYDDFDFNSSHAEGLVVCAIGRSIQVGIDVENLTRKIDPIALGRSVLSPQEFDSLCKIGAAERKDYFFSLWTLKESYIKMRGAGLSMPLDSFWFERHEASHSIRFVAGPPDPSERLAFFEGAPTSAHILALAISGWTQRSTPTFQWMSNDLRPAALIDLKHPG